ncbi:hypothetical protein RRG08_047276 [Elysia crispata]|uniref:Uncharacterized protein n=1 Tax=Elysia crispata TaxID=231223 RepID=A0AAE1DER4_9GAST|nr:hypothetical protein RRG08_047276 [Elysia crispata]
MQFESRRVCLCQPDLTFMSGVKRQHSGRYKSTVTLDLIDEAAEEKEEEVGVEEKVSERRKRLVRRRSVRRERRRCGEGESEEEEEGEEKVSQRRKRKVRRRSNLQQSVPSDGERVTDRVTNSPSPSVVPEIEPKQPVPSDGYLDEIHYFIFFTTGYLDEIHYFILFTTGYLDETLFSRNIISE